MRISDLFLMGLRNLSRRKARTILTILGVIIGSLSIIIMVSIGNGMKNNFNSQVMQQGGLTTITVNTYADIMDKDGKYVSSTQQKLDDNLVDQIKKLDHVRAVSPVINKNITLYCGKLMSWIYVTAMDYSTFEDFDFPALAYGSYPTEKDPSAIVFGSGAMY